MKIRRNAILFALWLALAAGAGYMASIAHLQRVQRETTAARLRELQTEADALRRDRDAIARDLAQAEQQLASLPPAPPEDPALTPARRREINAWLGRVKRLHQLFDEKPDQRIPEMQFLANDDWLRLAKTVGLESEEDARRALAEVRNLAVSRFMTQVAAATRKYTAATKNERPATLEALVDYFDPPVDATILARYEIADYSSSPGSGATWGVQNKFAVDPDYDTRQQVTSGGSASTSAPFAWVPGLAERYSKALRAYSRANQGDRPRGIAETLPFFNPPLEPELAERLIRTEHK
jgi:hypothetical protein